MTTSSIVIPVADPAPGLANLLRQLASWDLAGNGVVEVLVVDNNPARSPVVARTVDEVQQRQAGEPPIRLLHEPRGHSYAARNAGIDAASGAYVAFLDSDVVPRSSWVTALGRTANDGSALRTTGPIHQVPAELPRRLLDRSALLLDLLTGLPQERYARAGWAATANLVVRRDVFAGVGCFDASLESGGDFEFGRRAVRHGIAIRFDPELAVDHQARGSFRGLVTKACRVVRGHHQLQTVLGASEYREAFPQTRRRWWPLWQWMRLGIVVVVARGREDASLRRRLLAAYAAPLVGVAALREHTRRGVDRPNPKTSARPGAG